MDAEGSACREAEAGCRKSNSSRLLSICGCLLDRQISGWVDPSLTHQRRTLQQELFVTDKIRESFSPTDSLHHEYALDVTQKHWGGSRNALKYQQEIRENCRPSEETQIVKNRIISIIASVRTSYYECASQCWPVWSIVLEQWHMSYLDVCQYFFKHHAFHGELGRYGSPPEPG